MKTIKKIFSYIVILTCPILANSCFEDLDTMPLDDNQLVGEQVYRLKDGYTGLLAKCYASLILTGQQGGDGGNKDITNIDEGYSGYTRALFYLQELASDNFLYHSSTNGQRNLLNMSWDASNTLLIQFTYQRLYMSIAYCDEMLRECTESKLHDRGLWNDMQNDYNYYRAEARFIRAYCYTVLCDLFGAVPYVDENTGIKDIPEQWSRREIYDYIIKEADEIENELKAPGENVYGRIDRTALWFLLSRIYLNAKTWVNVDEYQKAYEYAKKVIDCGVYPLADDYRHIFLADNNTCKEIIWPLVQDGAHAQSSAGTNFCIKAFVNSAMGALYNTGIGNSWGNYRSKTTLVDAFDAADVPFNQSDTWGNNKNDKRAQFMTILDGQTKETWDAEYKLPSNFVKGYGYIKWRNVNKNDVAPLENAYSSIDFPMFRTGEAYLTAAEAILRGANASRSIALDYVNEIRMRAYMSDKYAKTDISSAVSGKIADAQLTLDFILAERQRELASELLRRTDLVRFEKFTKGHDWDWKGAVYSGADVDDKYNIFPIPESELNTNPTLIQNEGYPRN